MIDIMRLFRVIDFVEEYAPEIAGAGGATAAMQLAMSPSLPMTASSGTPPGMYKKDFFFLRDFFSCDHGYVKT